MTCHCLQNSRRGSKMARLSPELMKGVKEDLPLSAKFPEGVKDVPAQSPNPAKVFCCQPSTRLPYHRPIAPLLVLFQPPDRQSVKGRPTVYPPDSQSNKRRPADHPVRRRPPGHLPNCQIACGHLISQSARNTWEYPLRLAPSFHGPPPPTPAKVFFFFFLQVVCYPSLEGGVLS